MTVCLHFVWRFVELVVELAVLAPPRPIIDNLCSNTLHHTHLHFTSTPLSVDSVRLTRKILYKQTSGRFQVKSDIKDNIHLISTWYNQNRSIKVIIN